MEKKFITLSTDSPESSLIHVFSVPLPYYFDCDEAMVVISAVRYLNCSIFKNTENIRDDELQFRDKIL